MGIHFKQQKIKNIFVVIIILTIAISIAVFVVKPSIVQTREGIVTEVLHDCGDSEKLIDKKVLIVVNGTLCDGGDNLVVDGLIDISASSGMVPPQYKYWSKDVRNISAGDKVRATYKKVTNTNGAVYYNLDCEECKIEIIQKRSAEIPVERIKETH